MLEYDNTKYCRDSISSTVDQINDKLMRSRQIIFRRVAISSVTHNLRENTNY